MFNPTLKQNSVFPVAMHTRHKMKPWYAGDGRIYVLGLISELWIVVFRQYRSPRRFSPSEYVHDYATCIVY